MRPPRTGTVKPDGSRIKTLLAEKGIYRDELVKQTRLSSRVIDKVLAGDTVAISTLEAVALSLNVAYAHLVQQQTALAPSAPGVSLTCERTADGLTIKFQGEIKIQAESPETSPQVMAFIQFLKMSLPENTDIRLVSIGTAMVVFSVADTPVNADAVSQLRNAPKRGPSLSRWVSKSIPFRNNPLDDPAYWWLTEEDRQTYDKLLEARHDVPESYSTRSRNPLHGSEASFIDVRTWLHELCMDPSQRPGSWLSVPTLDAEEIMQKYDWAFEADGGE